MGLEVRDDGPGIDVDRVGKVFEPFFTTKDVGEGTGLGLSIALGIAEAHQGALTLVPTDSGTCFRLMLPSAGPLQVPRAMSATFSNQSPVPVADEEAAAV